MEIKYKRLFVFLTLKNVIIQISKSVSQVYNIEVKCAKGWAGVSERLLL